MLADLRRMECASTTAAYRGRDTMYPLILWLLGVPVGVILLLLLVGIL